MRRTPLGALHEARGAEWMEYQGYEIPAVYSDVAEEYEALQESVGLVDLSYRGLMRVTGRDRRSWLHGQVTQDINGLPDGKGAYAAILTPQGRIVSDLRVFALPEMLLVDTPAGTATPIPEYLDRFLIMERAEIEDLSDDWGILSLQGPQAPCVLGSVFGDEVTRLKLWEIREEVFEDGACYVARVPQCGEDGFDLFIPAHSAAALWGVLCNHRLEFAVQSVGWRALNIRRVEAGIPWWGEELDTGIVPLEARLEHAIHFRKGCYVGQEIIARIEARGQVNNRLAGFFVEGGAWPERGAEIRHEGKKVGTVSTVVHSFRLGRPIALGYLRRELQEPGTRVEAEAAAGPVALEVTELPFVPHDYPEPETSPAA